jgi:hypothetical protein
MNIHFANQDNIPTEVRPDVMEALARNRDRLSWDPQDLHFLFAVYNRYVAPMGEPEDMNCSGCRTKVIGKLRMFANRWTSN